MPKANMTADVKTGKVMKKRGRRTEKILDYDSEESISNDEKENDEDEGPPIIVKIPMDTSKFKNKKMKAKKKPEKKSDVFFENDIPNDSHCQSCSKSKKENVFLKKRIEDLEKQSKISKENMIVVNKPAIFLKNTGKKFVFEPSKIVCRNCMDNYENVPMPLIDYYNDTKKKYGYLKLFCSIGCALYFNDVIINDSLSPRRKSLTIHVFKLIHGDVNMDIEINSAPPLDRLKKLGGDLTIKQYRKKSLALNQKSIMYLPPMLPINTLIEERVDNEKEFDDDEFVLKRKKPINRKSTIQNMITKGKARKDNDESEED